MEGCRAYSGSSALAVPYFLERRGRQGAETRNIHGSVCTSVEVLDAAAAAACTAASATAEATGDVCVSMPSVAVAILVLLVVGI